MATADELTARIEKLKKARGSGVLTVRHGDQMTTFRSVAEMNVAIAADEQELAALNGSVRLVRTYRIVSDKGL